MSQIRDKNTKPEMVVRKTVFSLGYRYRLHKKSLPGCPDLVFPGRKKVIFVHGCFWHAHSCKYGKVKPKTRAEFWSNKIRENKERDRRNKRSLIKLGWDALIIWECELKNIDTLCKKITAFLDT